MDFRKASLSTERFERIIFNRALITIILVEAINFLLFYYYGHPWYIYLIPIAFISLFLLVLTRFRKRKIPPPAVLTSIFGLVVLLLVSYVLNGGIQGTTSSYTTFGGLFIILLIINRRLRNYIMTFYLLTMVLLIVLELMEVIQLNIIEREGALKHSNFIFVSIFIGVMIHSFKSFFDEERNELIRINRDLKGKQFLINNQYEALERQKHELKEINKSLDERIESRSKALEEHTKSLNEYIKLNSKELKESIPRVNRVLSLVESQGSSMDPDILAKIKNSFELFEQRLSENSL